MLLVSGALLFRGASVLIGVVGVRTMILAVAARADVLGVPLRANVGAMFGLFALKKAKVVISCRS